MLLKMIIALINEGGRHHSQHNLNFIALNFSNKITTASKALTLPRYNHHG